jgi:putative holliday junction resolvase
MFHARMKLLAWARSGNHFMHRRGPVLLAEGQPCRYGFAMAVVDLMGLRPLLARGARLLGLDVGSKTIGLALSDSALSVASPLSIIRRGKFAVDAEQLARLIAERGIGGLVIGLPIGMDGQEGPRCQSVRQFAANLLGHIELPIAFWDERFSTVGAERPLRDAEMSHRRRAEVIDKLAAAYILQGALDRLSRQNRPA